MKIEAVIACLNYGDFLYYTLPWAKHALDGIVVVTSQEDMETQQVCEFYDVRCLPTDAFVRYGGPLNKGAAINEGLAVLDRDDWLLILDADILLPLHVRPFLERAELNPIYLYGVDRRNCDGLPLLNKAIEEWGDFDNLPMMNRVNICGGNPPVGYFQLFHSSAIPHGPWYEDHYGFADRTDAIFSKRFDCRQYLDTWVVHLDNGGHVGGPNWRGRTSPRFVGEAELRLDLGLR